MIVRVVFDYTYHHHTLNKIRKPSLEMMLVFNGYKLISVIVLELQSGCERNSMNKQGVLQLLYTSSGDDLSEKWIFLNATFKTITKTQQKLKKCLKLLVNEVVRNSFIRLLILTVCK